MEWNGMEWSGMDEWSENGVEWSERGVRME